jgi:glycosyltransferase involved in cell wall biosynthesis
MKISIITACFNSEKTIQDTIESVLSQDYPNIEFIIVDGASTDNTLKIIKKYGDRIAKVISEKDRGIYDAMNKGIQVATGDIVGILNSDDFYVNNRVISKIVSEFKTKNVDSIFADLVYITHELPHKVVRYYRSNDFRPSKFAYGWMPAHPTFFVKRNIYEKYGLFNIKYKIASDFELLARFLAKEKISYSYIPETIIKMRVGGLSTKNFKSNWIINQEILQACNENDIQTNIFKIYSKYFTKFIQLIARPN